MTSSRILWLPLLCLAAPAGAQVTGLTARAKSDAEAKARVEITDLLRTLCPEQCVLVSVEARVDEETVSDAPPGFEAVTPGARVPVVRSIAANVTADSELPSAFRTKLKGLLSERIKAMGAQPSVNVEPVKFPPRNAPHLEREDPKDHPQDPLAQKPDPAPLPVLSPEEKAKDRLAEAAPLIAIASLFGLVLLAVAALLVIALRKVNQPPAFDEAYAELPPPAEPAKEEAQKAAGERPAGRPELPAARERALEKSVREERLVRNAVVREALSGGDAALVARWVRAYGDFLLEDVRPDSAPKDAIHKLAQELTRPPPADPSERAEALSELDGRMTAMRLLQGADTAQHAFAFLEGIPPDRFAAAAESLSQSSLEVAARLAPPEHRTLLLSRLDPARREELALGWVRRPEVSASHALAVADELGRLVADATGARSQLDRLLAEVVDSLPSSGQEAFLDRLRREGDGRMARALVTESTLRAAPVEVLSAAILAIPPARMVTYLSGADADLREQLLAACPAKVRGELAEELSLRGSQGEGEFAAARRELLSSLREEIFRRGLSPSELRPNGTNGRETTRA